MPAGPSGAGNADAASGRGGGGYGGGRGENGGYSGPKGARGLNSAARAGVSNRGNPSIGGGNGGSKTSVGRHNVKGYSHKSFGPKGLDFYGGTNGYDKLTINERRRVAAYRDPIAAAVHRIGSFFLPGVDSHLSVSPTTGELVSVDEFDTIGMVGGLIGVGNPIGKIAGRLYAGAKQAGYGAPTNTSTRAIKGFVNGQQVTGSGGSGSNVNSDRASGSPGNVGIEGDSNRNSLGKKKTPSLFDRAQNQLYPIQEENKPQLGVGVTTGASKVRRGPALSGLNRRRAIYGRVY